MKMAAMRTQGHTVYHLLAQAPLFDGLDEERLVQFAEQSQLNAYRKGQVLHLQDDEARWFYLVVSGWVKLFRETLEGEEAVLDVLPAGSMLGETSVFENGCYGCAAQVVEDAELIAMPTSLLQRVIAEDNRLAVNMLKSMTRYRQQQEREIEHLNAQNAPQRIGCFLLRLCDTDASGPVKLHLPYDKTLIASRLGMKPETFSRALAKLREHTGIRIDGPTVHIAKMDDLVTYSCNHCSTNFPCADLE